MRKLLFHILLIAILPISFNASGQGYQTASINNLDPHLADSFDLAKIIIAGDIILDQKQLSASKQSDGSYDFRNFFRFVQPILGMGDLVIGNLETNFNGWPYQGQPFYSSPNELATALKYGGFNFLVTANDHSIDHGGKGLNNTIDVLDKEGLDHTGTFKNRMERSISYPPIVVRNGMRIAVLNYTDHTNVEHKPEFGSVNKIFKPQIFSDLEMAKKLEADFIIVYFHWGKEETRAPSYNQKLLAKFCFDNGAHLVVGSHPHMVQRVEELAFYSKGKLKTGIVAYSLGNFMSSDDRRYRDGGILLEVQLCRNKRNKEISICHYGFVPVWTRPDDPATTENEHVLLPVACAEAGQLGFKLDRNEKERMDLFAIDTRLLVSRLCGEIRYVLSPDIINDFQETIEITGLPYYQVRQQNKEKVMNALGMDYVNADTVVIPNVRIEDNPLVDSNPDTIPDQAVQTNTNTTTTTNSQSGGSRVYQGNSTYGGSSIIETDTVYQVQFLELTRKIDINIKHFKYVKSYHVAQEGEWYVYYTGRSNSFTTAKYLCQKMRSTGNPHAKVMSFYNGKKVGKRY